MTDVLTTVTLMIIIIITGKQGGCKEPWQNIMLFHKCCYVTSGASAL